jgi:hypothetical protein
MPKKENNEKINAEYEDEHQRKAVEFVMAHKREPN